MVRDLSVGYLSNAQHGFLALKGAWGFVTIYVAGVLLKCDR